MLPVTIEHHCLNQWFSTLGSQHPGKISRDTRMAVEVSCTVLLFFNFLYYRKMCADWKLHIDFVSLLGLWVDCFMTQVVLNRKRVENPKVKLQ